MTVQVFKATFIGKLILEPDDEPPPVPDAPTRLVGGNLSGYSYWDLPRLTVNMLRQGEKNGFKVYDNWNEFVEVDEHGDPLHDFNFILHKLDVEGAQRDCIARAQGYVAQNDITTNYPQQVKMVDWVYDSVGNVTNWKVRYPADMPVASIQMKFRNTRRVGGPSGTPNTGLVKLQIAHPGYSIADIESKIWTDEAINFWKMCAPAPLRLMDFLQINNATYTWETAQRDATTRIGPPTWDMNAALAAKTGCDLYWQIPHMFSDSDADAAFNFLETQISQACRILFGFSNELWNSLFKQTVDTLVWTCVECKAFIGSTTISSDGHNRTFTASRDNGTVTVKCAEPHKLDDGQTVWFTSFDGMSGNGTAVTVHVLDNKQFLFQRNGANGPMTATSSHWFMGQLDTTLRYGPSYNEDSNVNIYQLKNRWCARRLMEFAERCRARVGDSKMMTRWFPIWEDQMINNTGDNLWGDPPLRYLEKKWPQRRVREYVGGLAGAPYFFCWPYQEAAGATQAQIVDALAETKDQSGQKLARVAYCFEGRACTAKYYGLSLGSIWYEGGPDTKSYTLQGADLQVRCAAQFDQGIRQACVDYMAQHFEVGGGLICWFNLGFLNPTDANRDLVWGVTDKLDNHDTPKLQAMDSVRSGPVVLTNRNRLDLGPVDCRFTQDVYEPAAGAYPMLDQKQKVPVYWNNEPADIRLRVTFTVAQPSQRADIFFNDQKVFSNKTFAVGEPPLEFDCHIDHGLNVIGFYPIGNARDVKPTKVEVV